MATATKQTKLTPRWYDLEFHPQQAEAYHSKKRFLNLACGRGSGKTEIMRRKIVRMLPVRKPWSDPLYFFALPTYNQAKRVAWNVFKDLIPERWLVQKHGKVVGANISDMCFETIFGSKLYIVGLDQPQRIEGVQWDGGVVDESCDQKPGVFARSIRPALSHRKGFCHRIGVPKRFGIGALEFKRAFDKGLLPPDHREYDEDVKSYNWPSSDILPPKELEQAKNTMSQRDYEEQYEASWLQAGGLIYYGFNEIKNVTSEVNYDPNSRLVVSCDFNVSPMSWVIGHLVPADRGRQLHIFDEIYINDTNTIECLNELWGRYGDHKRGITFYGDATSHARKSSAEKSDYLHILNDGRWVDKKVQIGRKNPSVSDRYASVNALMSNAEGYRRCFIHPRCKNLIDDLSVAAYKEGTKEINTQGGLVGHITDALGYIIWHEFPIEIYSRKSGTVMMKSF